MEQRNAGTLERDMYASDLVEACAAMREGREPRFWGDPDTYSTDACSPEALDFGGTSRQRFDFDVDHVWQTYILRAMNAKLLEEWSDPHAFKSLTWWQAQRLRAQFSESHRVGGEQYFMECPVCSGRGCAGCQRAGVVPLDMVEACPICCGDKFDPPDGVCRYCGGVENVLVEDIPVILDRHAEDLQDEADAKRDLHWSGIHFDRSREV